MTQTLTLFLFLLQIIVHVSTSINLYDECSSNGIGCADATWQFDGKTVAGGNGEGDALNQLNSTYGVFVNSDGAVFVTDYNNHRVVKWSRGASIGTLWAGGQCGQIDHGELCHPSAITFDKEGTMFVTVEDSRRENGSVISWKKDAPSGETLFISNTSFYGIALDAEEKYLYVGHHREHRVIKYKKDGTFDSVVAGDNGRGPALNQLDYPRGVAVDKSGSVYVSDSRNDRVVKWTVNAKEGILVAGDNGSASQTDQLNRPAGIIVDEKETIYIADEENHRIVSISVGTTNVTVIAGGYGPGNASNQVNNPGYLAFNDQGDLYVSDWNNSRVQMFSMDKSPSSSSHTDYIYNSFKKWTLIYCFLSFMISVAI